MILKASQRAGGQQLAVHLMRLDENDHVDVHQLRGFVADNLHGALAEAYASSRATQCKQFLFSASLNPPEGSALTGEDFERAADIIEQRLGLAGQARAIVIHEKRGRRHAHCVWSRIDAAKLKAVNLSHFKTKLQQISRELFVDYGWEMPEGLLDPKLGNPLNFTRQEWQQARRIDRDPKAIKAIFQASWAETDSAKSFARALEMRGYYLARGDRRGYVATDHHGEVYAIARWAGVRTKEVAARLGDPDRLPSLEEVQARIAKQVSEKLARFKIETKAEFDQARQGLAAMRAKLVAWQRHERQLHKDVLAARAVQEARERSERFRSGLRGVWDWITGRSAAIKRQNEQEFERARQRDAIEHQALIDRQLEERRSLHRQVKAQEERYERELSALHPMNALTQTQDAVTTPANRQVQVHRKRARHYVRH